MVHNEVSNQFHKDEWILTSTVKAMFSSITAHASLTLWEMTGPYFYCYQDAANTPGHSFLATVVYSTTCR